MSQPKLIYFFGEGTSEGDPARKDVLGGKGASLAAMSRAGLPVPPGFTISVECCRHYHERGQRWPDGLKEQLGEYLARLEKLTGRKLGRGSVPLLVSVRSGAAASMPGMMDTILNCGLNEGLASELSDTRQFWPAYRQFVERFVRTVAQLGSGYELPNVPHDDAGAIKAWTEFFAAKMGHPFPLQPWDTLVECINAVFESWNSDRAIAYRSTQDVHGADGTAVTVQAMFPSEVSGVAFTANPSDPLSRQIIIESSYGLGEAVVSGDVSPDLFILDRDNLAILRKTIGTKASSVATLDGPGHVQEASAFSLSDERVLEVANLSLKVEEYFGHPVDVEWGLAQGRLSLLQSRPVRGLEVAQDIEIGRQAEISRLREIAGDKRKVWVTHNLGETLAAPTPLTWDIIRSFMSSVGGFGQLYRDLGYKPSSQLDEAGFLELICGRIYADPDRAPKMFWPDMPLEYDLDAVVKDPALLDSAPARLDPKKAGSTFLLHLPNFIVSSIRVARRMNKIKKRAIADFNAILPAYLNYVQEKRQQNLVSLSTAEVIAELRERIDKVLHHFGRDSLKPGMFGGMALARLQARLTMLMGDVEARDLCGQLTSGLEGDSTVEQSIALFAVSSGQMPLEQFVETYGHRTVGEMELAQPRWREDSSYLAKMAESYQRSSAHNPRDFHKKNVAVRLAAEKNLRETLARFGGSSLYEEILELAREAQEMLPTREVGKHYLMMGYELLRLAIVELGRRWGLGKNVFFLHMSELADFEQHKDDLHPQIKTRKIRWQSAQRLLMDDVIDSLKLDGLGLAPKMEGVNHLDGLGLAPGLVEGTVRIIFSPDEAGDLPADCILVCPSTDPGWAALFPSISGLVVERGGVLSHGAIAARDFGIPAVACPHATKLLASATRVRLDGVRGHVVIIE